MSSYKGFVGIQIGQFKSCVFVDVCTVLMAYKLCMYVLLMHVGY